MIEAGFASPTIITHDTSDLHILDVETHPIIYKVWRNGVNTDSCFLLENREQKGFDTPLPGAGLLIWHIDYTQSGYYNVVDLEEDSTDHLSHGGGTRPDPHVYHPEMGAASDPLPGTWNRTRFDNTTKPNSKNNHGQPTNVNVTNVHMLGDTVVCDVWFGASGVDEQPGTTGAVALRVSPNPSHGTARISYSLPGSGVARLRLYDVTGELLRTMSDRQVRTGVSDFELRTSDLPSGVYLLRLEGARGSADAKLIVE
jgi:hypothetical protein